MPHSPLSDEKWGVKVGGYQARVWACFIIIICSEEMKYNREMRWLLFLIVPFLVMLAILVTVPLEINSKNHQHAYTLYRLSH